jgi:hypothetical protein
MFEGGEHHLLLAETKWRQGHLAPAVIASAVTAAQIIHLPENTAFIGDIFRETGGELDAMDGLGRIYPHFERAEWIDMSPVFPYNSDSVYPNIYEASSSRRFRWCVRCSR